MQEECYLKSLDEHSKNVGDGNCSETMNYKAANITCKVCNNSFTDEGKLSSHICNKIGNVYKCNVCDISFKKESKVLYY